MQRTVITTLSGVCVADNVTIAATFRARLLGLLPRRGIAQSEGLLLQPGGSVHTVGMRFPIDVLFLDRHLRILGVVTQLRPQRVARAPRRTHCVLELAAGRAQDRELQVGTQLRLLQQEEP